MTAKQCSKCKFAPATNGAYCHPCKAEWQRAYRAKGGNASTRLYEKTKSGFLMRLYRNMESRIDGVQQAKWHLYRGKTLLPREHFYWWAWGSPEFHELFAEWEGCGYDRKLAPSVDRINASLGYDLSNMEWVTHSENSRRGSLSQHRRRAA